MPSTFIFDLIFDTLGVFVRHMARALFLVRRRRQPVEIDDELPHDTVIIETSGSEFGVALIHHAIIPNQDEWRAVHVS